MNPNFHLIDFIILGIYAVALIGIGWWVSRTKKGQTKTAEDYFLASKALPWWAIGSSLIAANISAEQFIGMAGSGFAGGLAVASYEFMAALTLIIVGKFFLPIFIKQGIYTIPEFVERRFSTNLKTILAVFWIALFIFVNLTSVLYLGGKAIDTVVGTGDGSMVMPAIIALALFAAAYSLYGGLSAVAWTDVLQVALLVIGGVITTVIALNYVTPEGGVINGISHVADVAGDKFDMILSRDNKEYNNLPGIYVLIGGLWVANLYYWGFNQYIIQRTFAAKSVNEAQKGLVFAGYLKLIIPFLVVIPGIAAYVITQDQELMAKLGAGAANFLPSLDHADRAYPWLTQFLPMGVKGLVFAALAAAIVSSLASMLNSTATIFTMDIYKQYINKQASDLRLVNVGRLTAIIALIIAVFMAPMLGAIDQAFQFIQEYTGLVSPGILAVFMLGLFYKKTTTKAASIGVIASIPIALLLKFLPLELPFLDQMLYTFILTVAIIVFVSLDTSENDDDPKAIILTKKMFITSSGFKIGAYIVCIITAILYALFW